MADKIKTIECKYMIINSIPNWKPLVFGKHLGKTLPQVMFHDPDWFFYVWDYGAFQTFPSNHHHHEAVIIHAKATSIRVPQTGAEPLQVEYDFYPDGGSCGFDLVPVSQPHHQGATPTVRADLIDMCVPHRAKSYDKVGNRLFIKSIKGWLFGNDGIVMTRARCAEFFNDDSNFHCNG